MPLPSFLKRKAPPPPPAKGVGAEESAQAARVRARRRLIGSAVLLAAAVAVFPLLFESKPRPMPVDTPLVIRPVGDASAPPTPAAAQAARQGAVQKIEKLSPPVTAAAPAPEPAPAAASAAPRPATQSAQATTPTPNPAPAEPAAPAAPPAPKATAPASPAVATAAPASAAASDPKAQRFVVQVGAFADATAAREARQAVEKLGLKTYTQVIEVDGGKRIRVRVGPFATREEAARVLARIKGASLPGAVLAL